jgi:hypothetical protein
MRLRRLSVLTVHPDEKEQGRENKNEISKYAADYGLCNTVKLQQINGGKLFQILGSFACGQLRNFQLVKSDEVGDIF